MTEIVNQPVSQAEIDSTIVELEQYRDRLINDILEMGKKIKLSQKAVDKNIADHPEITQINQILEQLRSQSQ